jgi:hypothetical protein
MVTNYLPLMGCRIIFIYALECDPFNLFLMQDIKGSSSKWINEKKYQKKV